MRAGKARASCLTHCRSGRLDKAMRGESAVKSRFVPVIQLSEVTKSFGVRTLLDRVTWQIGDGDRVGLCGPNGAGKTTLLKMLGGPRRARRGRDCQAGGPDHRLPAPGRPDPCRPHRVRGGGQRVPAPARHEGGDDRHRAPAGGPLAARGGARRPAVAVRGPSGPVPPRRRLQHGFAHRHGAARAGVQPRRRRPPRRDVLGRLADAHRAGEAAAGPAKPAAAGRAHQSPRSRRAQLARGIPGGLPLRRHPGFARPLFPGRGRDPHHRPQPARADRLRGQLHEVRRPAGRHAGAAAAGQARAGRGSGAREDVHRPLPLPGHQGGPGAEPDQAARKGGAHRGAARAEAHPLHVSHLPEERSDGARTVGRAQGLRIADGVRARQPAHRAGRSHRARGSRTAPASRR